MMENEEFECGLLQVKKKVVPLHPQSREKAIKTKI